MENQVLDNEQIEQTQVGYDEIAFVTKVLDKQFELVGMQYRTAEIIEMTATEQKEIWSSYFLNDAILEDWYKYFIELCKENEGFKELDEDSLKPIFESIVNEWGFNFEPDEEYVEEDIDDEE